MKVSSVACTPFLLVWIFLSLAKGAKVSSYYLKRTQKSKAVPKSKSNQSEGSSCSSPCSTIHDFMNSTFVGHDERNTWYNVTLGVGGNFNRFSSVYEDEYLLGVFDSIEGNTALYTGGNYCNDLDGKHSGSVKVMEDKTLDFWTHFLEEEHECVNNLIILVPKLCSKENCLSSRTES